MAERQAGRPAQRSDRVRDTQLLRTIFRYSISEFEPCSKTNIGVVEPPPADPFNDIGAESLTPAPSTLSPSQV